MKSTAELPFEVLAIFICGERRFLSAMVLASKHDLRASCDFDYAGRRIETLMLGLAAHRTGKELEYDSVDSRVTNDSAANYYLTNEYRKAWVLNG